MLKRVIESSESERWAKLTQLIEDYVAANASDLDETYRWDVPSDLPECSFIRGGDSLAAANVRLKRSLAEAWQADPGRRFDLATWYVSVWGGVRTNHPGTIRSYVNASEEELVNRSVTGVASWSKILAIRNPDRYAIYDARVAAALNALQIGGDGRDLIMFPVGMSRNTTVAAFRKILYQKDRRASAIRIRGSIAYARYLHLVQDVAKRLSLNSPDKVEMTLFAKAEKLSRRAMLHSG